MIERHNAAVAVSPARRGPLELTSRASGGGLYMKRDFHFDSGWPVALVLGLIVVFIVGLTPAGRQILSEFLKPNPSGPVAPHPSRPDVLVATDNSDDQKVVAATVVPRGYNVLFADTMAIASQFLYSDANRIGLIVVNAESSDARRITNLSRSLAPDATLITLPPTHGATEVATLLLGAI